MPNHSLASRITSPTAAYVVALLASAVAVWLTGVLTYNVGFAEGNPAMQQILATVGWSGLALAKVAGIMLLFGLTQIAPVARRAGAWSVASVMLVDLSWNSLIAAQSPIWIEASLIGLTNDPPHAWSPMAAPYIETLTITLILALLAALTLPWLARRTIWTPTPTPEVEA